MSEARVGSGRRGDDLLVAASRGVELARELLRESEVLRRSLAEAGPADAGEPAAWEAQQAELLGRIHELERELAEGQQRMRALEAESRASSSRRLETEQENERLANLYVASHQLHSTLDPDEVIRVVVEIAINLVGAERLAVLLLDERRGELRVVAAQGVDPARLPVDRPGEGWMGDALARGEVALWEPGVEDDADPSRPLACIPLRVEGQPLGVIAIFGLLRQKQGLTSQDHEIFRLLGAHAATAILSARLHAQSGRKLEAIQGFLDLLAN